MEERSDILLFFDGHPGTLPLFEALKEKLLQAIPDTDFRVGKTQISLYHDHMYGCVSFLPARRACMRPREYITVTVGLDHPLDSSRVDQRVQVRSNRWTHHILVGTAEEIDSELLAWLTLAAARNEGGSMGRSGRRDHERRKGP